MSMVAHWTQLILPSYGSKRPEAKNGDQQVYPCPWRSTGWKRKHRRVLSSFRGWDVQSSASGAVARCGSSKLRCPCVGDEGLHPTAGVRSATWTDRGLGGKKTEGVGAEWGSGCTRRSRLQIETVVSLNGWETVASPGASAPGMSPTPRIPPYPHPWHTPYSTCNSLASSVTSSSFACWSFCCSRLKVETHCDWCCCWLEPIIKWIYHDCRLFKKDA